MCKIISSQFVSKDSYFIMFESCVYNFRDFLALVLKFRNVVEANVKNIWFIFQIGFQTLNNFICRLKLE